MVLPLCRTAPPCRGAVVSPVLNAHAMSANLQDLIPQTRIPIPHGFLKKANAADFNGARVLCRALDESGKIAKLNGKERGQLFAYLEALERRTKILARLRYDLYDQDNVIAPDILLKIFEHRGHWIRDPRRFRRPSHNPFTQLYALIHHLFARYPTAPFMVRAFEGCGRDIPYYIHIAQGGNIRSCPGFSPRLSKTQAHLFHTFSGEVQNFRQAALLAMARSYGVTDDVARALICNRHVQANHFDFWASFMEFLGRQAMVNPLEIHTLCDYLHRHRVVPAEDPRRPALVFSFRGRTMAALVERAQAWHEELIRERRDRNRTWEPIAVFRQFMTSDEGYGWQMNEILSERELMREGRAMHHCVFTYLDECLERTSAIFSLTRRTYERPAGFRCLTVELVPQERGYHAFRIIQATGKHNSDPEPEELQALKAWAKANRVLLADYLQA